jgi:tRNA pseudouridine55 synthase
VDKPEGPTSHDVVARARRVFRTRAIGHTGTLDPFATGLLILVFGGATRLARWAERHRKVYRAEVRLGSITDTDDRTGTVLEEGQPGVWPSRDLLDAALTGLVGEQSQRPPAFSAKRVGGERSHRLARRGGNPEPAAVPVSVFSLTLLEYAPPLVSLRAEVSAGTYIRALARDLGQRLGTGAHLAELRRESIGPWRVADATPLAGLTGSEPLIPARALVDDLQPVPLAPDELAGVAHGRDVAREGPTDGEAALLDGDRLVAVARAVPLGWHPVVVLP